MSEIGFEENAGDRSATVGYAVERAQHDGRGSSRRASRCRTCPEARTLSSNGYPSIIDISTPLTGISTQMIAISTRHDTIDSTSTEPAGDRTRPTDAPRSFGDCTRPTDAPRSFGDATDGTDAAVIGP